MQLTKQQVRTAAWRAADYIKRHPDQYNYFDVCTPGALLGRKCACMWGWMGHFLGYPKNTCIMKVYSDVAFLLPLTANDTEIALYDMAFKNPMLNYHNSSEAAEILGRFVAKWFPVKDEEERRQTYTPRSVLDIFKAAPHKVRVALRGW